jgi:hypothetical protein
MNCIHAKSKSFFKDTHNKVGIRSQTGRKLVDMMHSEYTKSFAIQYEDT